MPPTVWTINTNQYSRGYLYLEMLYLNHHLKRNNVFVFSDWYSQTVTIKRAMPQKMKEFIGASFQLAQKAGGATVRESGGPGRRIELAMELGQSVGPRVN
jgi:hypothetical protein